MTSAINWISRLFLKAFLSIMEASRCDFCRVFQLGGHDFFRSKDFKIIKACRSCQQKGKIGLTK